MAAGDGSAESMLSTYFGTVRVQMPSRAWARIPAGPVLRARGPCPADQRVSAQVGWPLHVGGKQKPDYIRHIHETKHEELRNMVMDAQIPLRPGARPPAVLQPAGWRALLGHLSTSLAGHMGGWGGTAASAPHSAALPRPQALRTLHSCSACPGTHAAQRGQALQRWNLTFHTCARRRRQADQGRSGGRRARRSAGSHRLCPARAHRRGGLYCPALGPDKVHAPVRERRGHQHRRTAGALPGSADV